MSMILVTTPYQISWQGAIFVITGIIKCSYLCTIKTIHKKSYFYIIFRVVWIFIYLFVYFYIVCMSNRPVLPSSSRNKGAIIYTVVRVLKILKIVCVFLHFLTVSNQ